jgi:calcineurin-like phosphoesterase
MSPHTPGRGLAVHGGVAVINLLGTYGLTPFESPFLAADRLVDEGAIRRFVTGYPTRLEPATGDVRIEGALVECGADGRATSCELVRVPVTPA